MVFDKNTKFLFADRMARGVEPKPKTLVRRPLEWPGVQAIYGPLSCLFGCPMVFNRNLNPTVRHPEVLVVFNRTPQPQIRRSAWLMVFIRNPNHLFVDLNAP